MPYIPNPADPTQPFDTEAVASASAEFRALKQYLATQLAAIKANMWQTGDIRLALTPVVPAGWLRIPVAASVISRVTYPALTAWIVALGSPWGIGDGTTTIGLPFIPEGYTIGNTGVAGLGTTAVGAVIAHTHTTTACNVAVVANYGYTGAPTAAYPPPSPQVSTSTGGAANLPAVAYTAFLIKT